MRVPTKWRNALVVPKKSRRCTVVPPRNGAAILVLALLGFGSEALSDLKRPTLQAYIAHLDQQGYAPKTIDHIHDVLSALLRIAKDWGYLNENPARGLSLPTLTTIRPKHVLTAEQAARLLDTLPPLPKAMVGIALATGIRRGELFGLRWHHLDTKRGVLAIREAVYDGHVDTPKTRASVRDLPLSPHALSLFADWRTQARRTGDEDLVFATRSGLPISPNNVLRRWVYPACTALGLPRSSWLTFRRTYTSWAHDHGVPHKVLAELLGHANVYTTLNVYTQSVAGAKRAAAAKIGEELFRIVQKPERAET